MSGKPRLNVIRKMHGIELDQLAKAAGLEMRIVYLAGIGVEISAADSEKIMVALTRITGELFTKNDIRLNIKNLLEPALPDRPTQRFPYKRP
jgi:hypothetical protein